MLIFLASPDAIMRNGKPDPQLARVLIKTRAEGNPVGLISNHAEPPWFSEVFGCSEVQFLHSSSRQSGEIIVKSAAKFKLSPYDAIVLAVKNEDVQMGKNGGAILVAAAWSASPEVSKLGICVDTAEQLQEVISLVAKWSGAWWFWGGGSRYNVWALSDLSGHGHAMTQQLFAKRLTNTIKGGGSKLNALLAITARSLLMKGIGGQTKLVWGVYPSSNSDNKDNEILSDFTHRLRTTVSRVHFAKQNEPLFIRHVSSPKRSAGEGGSRMDPTEQVVSIHLNPFYKTGGRLAGKHVVVVDDVTTYGVSFGVAAAFLKKAGAASITGVALGKFGNQLRHYEIEITANPFEPVTACGFTLAETKLMVGETSKAAQQSLLDLMS